MPALQQAFNSAQYDPATGFTQLPVGEHPVIIVASSVEGNKQQTGGYVKLSVKAIDGPANGLSMDWRINLYNASQKAAEIAHRQLSAICHAVGVPQFVQTEELHGKPFIVVVTPQKEEPEKYNEISACKYINGESIKPGQYGVAGGGQQQAQGQQGGAWGGQPAQGQQQGAQGQAWGGQAQGQAQGQAPQQGGNPAWGGAPQQGGNPQQGQQTQGGAAWGGGQAANQGNGQQQGQWQQGGNVGNKPAWG